MAKKKGKKFTVPSPAKIESVMIARADRFIQSFQAREPRRREAMLRIALLIEAQAKLNIRSRRLIDTGRLLNSIKHEIEAVGNDIRVIVGSFAVPYARVHEFGSTDKVEIPDHDRTITQAFGQQIAPLVVRVRAHKREMNIKARPYLRPAFTKHKRKIIDILREANLG